MSKPSFVPLLLALSALGLLLSGVVGQWDYEAALMAEADYCDRLLNRVHADYDNLRAACVERHWSK